MNPTIKWVKHDTSMDVTESAHVILHFHQVIGVYFRRVVARLWSVEVPVILVVFNVYRFNQVQLKEQNLSAILYCLLQVWYCPPERQSTVCVSSSAFGYRIAQTATTNTTWQTSGCLRRYL